MQFESDAQTCVICGEPATRSFGSSGAIPLCPLSVCEQTLADEINFELDINAALERRRVAQQGAVE